MKVSPFQGAALVAAGLMTAGFVAPASAAFVLVDDFDTYSAGQTTVVTGGVWHAEFSDPIGNPADHTGNSNIVVAGAGNALETLGGAPWRGSEMDLTGSDAALLVGETQTFFWQVYADSTSGTGYDFMMGLAPTIDDIDITDAWRDFSVMPFVNNGATTPFINAEAPTSPWWAPMEADTWTNVWLVVNNDAVDPSFDLYYSTGTDAPVLVAGDANWRNHAVGLDLNAIGFMAAGGGGSRLLVDNIYYADGEDLTNPVPEPASLAMVGLAGLTLIRRR